MYYNEPSIKLFRYFFSKNFFFFGLREDKELEENIEVMLVKDHQVSVYGHSQINLAHKEPGVTKKQS